ncbi:MAG: sugar transferase [Rhizobiaceae bacterium]|nr:sugar transferase [Rhizobiaceae bacterium]
MKRIFDVLASVAGLVVFGWMIVLLALVVQRSSQGPGLFAQPRIGRGRAVFTCYKLRTMCLGTAQAASHETPASAVTPLGAFLRAYKLDELPQLWNVLLGEMSFVGPRPCLPIQTRLIEERAQRGVHVARPGITGLAQVQGVDMSDPVRLAEIDATYVSTRSFSGDIALIMRTVLGSGRGDHVGM